MPSILGSKNTMGSKMRWGSCRNGAYRGVGVMNCQELCQALEDLTHGVPNSESWSSPLLPHTRSHSPVVSKRTGIYQDMGHLFQHQVHWRSKLPLHLDVNPLPGFLTLLQALQEIRKNNRSQLRSHQSLAWNRFPWPPTAVECQTPLTDKALQG